MPPERIELIDPILPPVEPVLDDVRRVFESKRFTNAGPFVKRLEHEVSESLGCRHGVATTSGTLGLMAVFAALRWTGEVIVPAFTFPATAHAIRWAGLRPVFADVDPHTFTLDPASVAERVGADTVGIVPVTCFGVPSDLDAIAEAAPGIPIVVDDAHGFGSRAYFETRPVASVMSLHATKLVSAGEGGLVLTDADELAAAVRRVVNFGFLPQGGECLEVGLNAKMPELSAVLAIHALPMLAANVAARRAWADRYRARLGAVPGLTFQGVPDDIDWNAQMFAVLVDPEAHGVSRDGVRDALDAHGVVTRRYFHPAAHQLACYAEETAALPVTERLSERVLCLPLRAASPASGADRISDEIRSLTRAEERA